jgi:hypothetical protein
MRIVATCERLFLLLFDLSARSITFAHLALPLRPQL